MMRWRTAAIIGATLALGAGLIPASATAEPKPVYEIDWDRIEDTIDALEAATGEPVMSGEIAGAAWIAQVPQNWNGDLLIYAHGYAGEGTDLSVGPPPAVQFLIDEGYAWAASSYRRNSYDPGIGVIDTKNLTRHMQAMLGNDLDRTYLAGFSMGGHVTAAAIERYPSIWDGAMPACGVLGDVELFDYFLDYNVGAAAFAGLSNDYTWPDANWLTTTVPDIKAGLSNQPAGLVLPPPPPPTPALFTRMSWAGGFLRLVNPAVPSPLNADGAAFKEFVEVGSGGDRVTFDVAWEYWHGIDAPAGEFFFGLGQGDGTLANRSGAVARNDDMTYAGEYGAQFAAIDDVVKRTTAANRVRKSQGMQPTVLIDGTPPVPVLTIHTTGDLFVPIEMEQIYAREVAANGLSDLLVQRAIRDVGHCTFTNAEVVQAYSDLFTWVETGVRPAGEDLIADISSPSLGCDFTTGAGGSGLRGFLEPCP